MSGGVGGSAAATGQSLDDLWWSLPQSGVDPSHGRVWRHVTPSSWSPEHHGISRLRYACAVTPHRAISAMFYAPLPHFAEITLSRMTAAPSAVFWPTFLQSFFGAPVVSAETLVEWVWNVMAHAQKPDFVFRRIGRVHLNRRGRQFSRLMAAEVCASAIVMLDTPCSEVVWEYWLPTPFASFPFPSPHVRHRVPSGL